MELIFVFIGIIAAGFLLLWIMAKRRPRLSLRDQKFIMKEWRAIYATLAREPKHALVEADRLLDFALKKLGYAGTVAQKLRRSESLFSNIDSVWDCHRLRNRVIHEVGRSVTDTEVAKALLIYKQALWDLGVKGRLSE